MMNPKIGRAILLERGPVDESQAWKHTVSVYGKKILIRVYTYITSVLQAVRADVDGSCVGFIFPAHNTDDAY